MTDRQVFVAREHELEQLDAFLQRTLAGQACVSLAPGDLTKALAHVEEILRNR